MLRLRSSIDAVRSASPGRRRSVAAITVLGLLGATAATGATSGASYSSSSTGSAAVTAAADWVAPTVAVVDPGTPLRGTVALKATASDAGSGVASIAVQVAPNDGSGSSYSTVCTATTSPASCSWKTTGVADGAYKVRAIATDKASNSATSAVVSNRIVDNTAPVASLRDPGTDLVAGDVPLTVDATDATSGVASVTIQRATAGSSTWTDVCTTTSSAATCTWAATAGTYDLRAIVVDRAGNSTTTAVVSNRTVVVPDTIRPFGVRPLATVNAGTAGRIESGDKLELTYSEPLALSSIVPGWTSGRSPQFSVRVRTPTSFFGVGANDTLDFADSDGASTANLGSIDLGRNGYARFLIGLGVGVLRSTATATATTNADGTFTVTVTLGTVSGTAATTVSGRSTMVWTPSTDAQDLAGNAATSDAVTQSPSAVNF